VADLYAALRRQSLTLDQTDTPLEVDRSEVDRFYAPLARLALARVEPERRALVAVAGPPGSGKSAFAATLVAAINALAGEDLAALVGLDGWHWPNAYLENHFVEVNGARVALRALKGAPASYNQAGIAAFLERARRPEALAYPVYSRALHDPLPDGGRIDARQRLLVLEGNYWLLDEPPWRDFRRAFDLSVFLTAAPEALLSGLRERHRRGGKSEAAIACQMHAVDQPDIDLVLARSAPADVTVTKADSRWIQAMEIRSLSE
jgi:pantothenate kinase